MDDRFFVIDSDNLVKVKTSFYGYMVSTHGIYDKDNWTRINPQKLSGLGAYIYIERKDDIINIYQDFNGSWGLYFYQEDDYFAISNSIIKMIEFLAKNRKLTLNRHYANKLLSAGYACFCTQSTIAKEIILIGRDVKIQMVLSTKEIRMIKKEELNSVSIDTSDGIALLDTWYKKWCQIFRCLNKKTNFMSIDLSGGFDTRMSLALVLGAGIEMDTIRVNSYNGDVYTHAEDFLIAKSIAKEIGFELNRPYRRNDTKNLNMSEIIENAFYSKLLIHKEFFWRNKIYSDKLYVIDGAGGEALRQFRWGSTKVSYVKSEFKEANKYGEAIAEEMRESILHMIEENYDCMRAKDSTSLVTNIEDPNPIYRETINRMHFGKICVEYSYGNLFKLEPLIDPDVYRIKKNTEECQDNDLIMAIIFTRYCPKLLEFKVQGERKISDETLRYAKSICERFPYNPSLAEGDQENEFDIIPTDSVIKEKIGGDNVALGDVDYLLCEMMHSDKMHALFTKFFDPRIYEYAIKVSENAEYVPLREFFGILGISKFLYEIEKSDKPGELTLLESLIDMSGVPLEGLQKRLWTFPYKKVPKGSRIVLYGAGHMGKCLKQQIDENHYCSIVKWVDRNYENKADLDVDKIESILEVDFDLIVIAIISISTRNNALKQLENEGIERTKIVVVP